MGDLPSPTAQHFAPPLRLQWQVSKRLHTATIAENACYGITDTGSIVALDASTGATRWQSTGTFVTSRLAVSGTRLFAYKQGEGLAYIDDQGESATERLALSFAASDAASLSYPVVDGTMVYVAVNHGMLAIHQEQGLQFGAALGDNPPYMIGLVESRDLVVVDGYGVPSRYTVTADAFRRVWAATPVAAPGGQAERPFTITRNRVIVATGNDLVAYDLANGSPAWRLTNVPARALRLDGDILYAGFHNAAIWAVHAESGDLLWNRQYLNNIALHRENGLTVAGDYVYWGGTMVSNPDGAILLAVHKQTAQFAWLSRGIQGAWVGGVPKTNGDILLCFGGDRTGVYTTAAGDPPIQLSDLAVTPNPLQGRSSGFGTGKVSATLRSQATVSIASYREQQGLGSRIVNNASWSQGTHEASWNPGSAFTDANQFGFVLVEVTERGQEPVCQSFLLPVNTFPDVIWHWARNSIETMVYHRFVSGYPDQTFKPNNLVTRAESSTIIAKTLQLQGPSAGFRTKFTDISSHWAGPYIMALEERGVINGFQESDGTFTFRPNLNMNRGQEARILVNAYVLAPAPDGFQSRFTDIRNHWAEADIRALEAAGYVNGFREGDGTFTYRPDQNLTRAELCTVIVRIQKLTR